MEIFFWIALVLYTLSAPIFGVLFGSGSRSIAGSILIIWMFTGAMFVVFLATGLPLWVPVLLNAVAITIDIVLDRKKGTTSWSDYGKTMDIAGHIVGKGAVIDALEIQLRYFEQETDIEMGKDEFQSELGTLECFIEPAKEELEELREQYAALNVDIDEDNDEVEEQQDSQEFEEAEALFSRIDEGAAIIEKAESVIKKAKSALFKAGRL